MNPSIQLKRATPPFLGVFVLVCLTLSLRVQAVVPPPDGGYPGFTTAEGQNALFSLTTGVANTAVGWRSLFSNATGSFNTATGAGTLLLNHADQNTATGAAALLFNTTGANNTATGAAALLNNTEGGTNTANGAFALSSNTAGERNTATGAGALNTNTTGGFNTAVGSSALTSNDTGGENTAIGAQALHDNVAGDDNTAVGNAALFSDVSGSNNIALGAFAGISVSTASNVIAIGTTGANVDNSCYIGQIYGTFNTAQSAVVYIDPDGRLGTGPSARRFKKDIADMGTASEVLLSMRPVTFHFKTQATEKAGREISQFGLIAEEVAEVNPDLILRDKEGEIYSVRYDAVNAMLLNEFLKEHRKNEKQEATIAELKTEVASLFAIVKEQAVQIQKVSEELDLSKAAPQTVLNRQ